MMIYWIINNYVLGSRLRITPTHKIIEQTRLDKSHTKVVYQGLTEREVQLCEKCFARRGTPVSE
jgi:hypothetical protein